MAAHTESKSIVIGLDFGTTYSGVAWALVDDQKRVEVVSTWPGRNTRTSVKVPSVLVYSGNRVIWGWQALASQHEQINGLKLLLDDDQSYRYSPSLRAKKLLGVIKKTPIEVAAVYLEQLISHVQHILERRFGPAVNDIKKNFILTVPAVWSDKAKDSTFKVAMKAGIAKDQLCLLSEPEAAALHTLHAIHPNTIKKGGVFIVCDAGGGTVDLISYRVNNLSPLTLEEVVEGTGGICGSMILDERFESFLEEHLGFEALELLPSRSRVEAIQYWRETIKPNFVGIESEDESDDVGCQLPLPGIPDMPLKGLEGGYLQLSAWQIQGIFDPVVQDVLNLVQTQVRKIKISGLSIEAVLLVGGFGASEYLFRRLREANPRLVVMQPPDAWQAIACGAVLRGLEGNQVKSRVARGHYGVSVRVGYDQRFHTESEKCWCKFDEKWKVRNMMSWFLKKGASISENDPVRHSFYRVIACDDEQRLIFHLTLYFSSAEIAPERLTNKVQKHCELQVDLRNVPKRLFKKRTNSQGLSYYKINYNIALIPTSGYMYFQLEFNGVSYGSVQADY